MSLATLIYALFCFMIGFTVAKSRNLFSLIFLSFVLMTFVIDPGTVEFVKGNIIFYTAVTTLLVVLGMYTAKKSPDHWTFYK